MRKNFLPTGKPQVPLTAVAVFCAFLSMPLSAHAQCEDPGSASSAMNTLVQEDIRLLNLFVHQEWNFIDEDLSNTASAEVAGRFSEFDRNILAALNAWWIAYLDAMKTMTMQWSTIQIDQSVSMGMMMDAQSVEETKLAIDEREATFHRRFRPSEGTCQIDTVGAGSTIALRVAKGLAKSYASMDHDRRSNKAGAKTAKCGAIRPVPARFTGCRRLYSDLVRNP